ncbi:MAG: Gfo/Idh/MocA family oxidoreductase [Planctomycetes bacterium]|nr:Gfo/Idh/MocA family oxidoreductase [Planctomycetota bacterium]
MKKLHRRKFIGACALGGAAAIGLRGAGAAYPANEAIRVGCIGTGGRLRGALMPAAKKVQGVRLAAVCDVWDRALEEARAVAHEGAFATKDHRAVLERKDIHAVMVATSDHWHVPITVDACEAGKDVYVEKPLTHDASEGKRVIEAQDKHSRIVQVGTQQRSMPQFQKAHELVKSGHIGEVQRVRLSWNRNVPIRKVPMGVDPKTVDWKRFLGNAPDQPFDEQRFRHWRWFWDFGGGILTDLMVHYIDIAHWFLGLEHPLAASAIGDHHQTEGFWETPDTIQTLLRFPGKVQVHFEGSFSNARNAARIELLGTRASLYLDRGRYEVHPERGQVPYSELVPGKSPRGADFDDAVDGELLHVTNWIECVRSRKKPNAPAEAGVIAVTGAHLGNLAYRAGRVARWEELARA